MRDRGSTTLPHIFPISPWIVFSSRKLYMKKISQMPTSPTILQSSLYFFSVLKLSHNSILGCLNKCNFLSFLSLVITVRKKDLPQLWKFLNQESQHRVDTTVDVRVSRMVPTTATPRSALSCRQCHSCTLFLICRSPKKGCVVSHL